MVNLRLRPAAIVAIATAFVLVAPRAASAGVTSQTGDPALAQALDKTNDVINQAAMAQTQAQGLVGLAQADTTALQGRDVSASLSQQDQLELQLRMTGIQQQWSVVSSALQTLNQMYMSAAEGIRSGSAPSAAIASPDVPNDFDQTVSALQEYDRQVQMALQQLETGNSGNVNLGTMFHLQFQMQIMSQYIESVSNTLAAIHNEMITMARATKGQ